MLTDATEYTLVKKAYSSIPIITQRLFLSRRTSACLFQVCLKERPNATINLMILNMKL